MNQTIISAGQCLLDVALQELGTVAAAFDLAAANGLAITDSLTPGQVLIVPASANAQAEVAAYFASRGQRINTANAPAVHAPAPDPAGLFDDTYDVPFN